MLNPQKKQFRVLVERDEDGFFVASVPSLPGCYTQAKNYSDLMTRVREAIHLCLDVAKTDESYRKKAEQFSYEPSFFGIEFVSL